MLAVRLRAKSKWAKRKKRKGPRETAEFREIKHIRNTILAGGVLVFANSVPAFGCEASFEIVRVLDFGEVVNPSNLGTLAWVQVDLDGSVTLSNNYLNPTVGGVNVVELGRLKISIENAEKGSAVEIVINATESRFELFPASAVSYKLQDESTSGEFYLNFGGKLFFDSQTNGKLLGNLHTVATCKS